MKRIVLWLAKRYGITEQWQKHGYEWGFRVARAHPEMDSPGTVHRST